MNDGKCAQTSTAKENASGEMAMEGAGANSDHSGPVTELWLGNY